MGNIFNAGELNECPNNHSIKYTEMLISVINAVPSIADRLPVIKNM